MLLIDNLKLFLTILLDICSCGVFCYAEAYEILNEQVLLNKCYLNKANF